MISELEQPFYTGLQTVVQLLMNRFLANKNLFLYLFNSHKDLQKETKNVDILLTFSVFYDILFKTGSSVRPHYSLKNERSVVQSFRNT